MTLWSIIAAFALVSMQNPEAADAAPKMTFGQPIPMSRRAVTLPALGLEVDFRYGLVGNSPTRFINDIRFAPLDWLELRTALNPYPDSLMAKVAFGDLDSLGVLSIDTGLFKLDLGLRLNPDEAEAVKGVIVANFGAGLGYDHSITNKGRLHVTTRLQHRVSSVENENQTAAMLALSGQYDLASYLGMTLGLGYGQVVAGKVLDFTLNFAETGRSGFSTLLDRDNDRSATVYAGLTYARTERFDVDIFATLRYWPEPGTIFGAGLRWRL